MDQYTRLYMRALASKVGFTASLQSFIDNIIDRAADNRLKEYLRKYLEETRELVNAFQLDDELVAISPTLSFLGSDGQNYKVTIRRVHEHFSLYISIPPDHPLNGKSYDQVEGATFSGREPDENSGRWVFGWDYSHLDDCTVTAIYTLAECDAYYLVTLRIINRSLIEREISHYVELFARQQLM